MNPDTARILPDRDTLERVVGKHDPVHLLWFLRLAGDAGDARAALGPVIDHGASVLWTGRTESLLIGRDPLHWTHAVYATAPRAALDLAAGATGPGVEQAALWAVTPRPLPLVAKLLFRALRPLGRLLESDPREAVRRRPATMDDSDFNPSQPRLEALAADPRTGRTTMINLLGFREKADYGAAGKVGGREVSGRAAYMRYGLVAARSVAMVGGSMEYLGRLRGPLLDVEGLATSAPWHDLAIVHYPAPSTIVKLEAMPGYAGAVAHRTAGLTRSTIVVAR
jgi:hypothetical protein